MCKDAFKGLREKYLRVRFKQDQLGIQWSQWEHFEALQFLEPHIVARRSITSYFNEKTSPSSENSTDGNFFKDLINLVHQCRPLWDRDTHDKPMKMQLWRKIAKDLGVDADVCKQKWKSLREKYIRQKQRYQEGREKWELLDDLSFLDGVINYRKKFWSLPDHVSTDSQFDQFSSDCDQTVEFYAGTNENHKIKTEDDFSSIEGSYAADSSLDGNKAKDVGNIAKKRPASTSTSECCPTKERRCEHTKTPEDIFGEFVAATLATKSESQRNIAMIKIMAVLTETN